MTTFGVILFVLGAFVTLLNVYFSFLRYPIHRARGGTHATYRWVSGIPLFGSLFLWISIGLLPSAGLQWVAGILSIFDTGGYIGSLVRCGGRVSWAIFFAAETTGHNGPLE